MSQHYVCISFDFDAMSGMVVRGLTTPTPVSRGEFGAAAIPRILDLLKRYDVCSSFFIPGVVIGTYPERCEQVLACGHEIAHHGWTHAAPASLTPEQEEAGLVLGIEKIRELTGAAPRGYRSPSWDLSNVTVDLLLKYNFFYESSMMGHDHEPYRVRQGDIIPAHEPVQFGKPSPLIELPVSWTLDDFPHFEFLRVGQSILPGLQNASGVLENWVDDFEYMRQSCEWGILTYTFHPFVIGRGHRMLMLEKLLKTLQEKGARFITLEQAATLYDQRSPFRPA